MSPQRKILATCLQCNIVSSIQRFAIAKKQLTWQDVNQSIFEFVHWQTGANKLHWVHLHARQPLQQIYNITTTKINYINITNNISIVCVAHLEVEQKLNCLTQPASSNKYMPQHVSDLLMTNARFPPSRTQRDACNVRNTMTHTHVTNSSDAIGHFSRCLRQIRTRSISPARRVLHLALRA